MFTESKNLKRVVSVSAAALCLLSSLRIAPVNEIESIAADTTLSAFEITEEMTIGWNLGNTLDATISDKNGVPVENPGLATETSWGCPKATQELFDAIKAKGFNTVRVPTTWFQHLDENDNIDPEWMARVKEVVDYGIKNDMYIILNVHHENWINRTDLVDAYDDIKPRLLKIWSQVSEEFKDYDQHLIFECMNEPRAVGKDWEWWWNEPVAESEVINKLEHDFVDLIRSGDGPYAKTRLLMLPGYCASHELVFTEAIDVPDDPYVAVSIHAYSPYNFTMNTGKDGQHDTFTSQFNIELETILTNMRNTFIDKNIPVVIGEMGASDFGNTEARCAWATTYITTAKKYGIPCVLWDNNQILSSDPLVAAKQDKGELHGYIDRNTYEWYPESEKVVDTMMSIINDDSIEWGCEGHLPELKHQALSDGTLFLGGPIEIDAAKADTYQNTTPGGDGEVSWSQLENKEVAIKFTGATPVLCFSDTGYGNWTEINAYTVDSENGIAYYLMSSVPDAWGEDPASIAHMQAKTLKVTNVEGIYILNEPEGEIDTPKPTSKIYKISIKDVDREKSLAVTIEGAAGTKMDGCVGYVIGEDWNQITWNGAVGADGKVVITTPLADIPASVERVEFQIWSNFDAVDMTSYEFTDGSTEPSSEDVSTGNGDANCDNDVNMADAVLIMQYLSNPDIYGVGKADGITEKGLENADVYGNDGVTNADALAIQEYRLALIEKLPVPAGVEV